MARRTSCAFSRVLHDSLVASLSMLLRTLLTICTSVVNPRRRNVAAQVAEQLKTITQRNLSAEERVYYLHEKRNAEEVCHPSCRSETLAMPKRQLFSRQISYVPQVAEVADRLLMFLLIAPTSTPRPVSVLNGQGTTDLRTGLSYRLSGHTDRCGVDRVSKTSHRCLSYSL